MYDLKVRGKLFKTNFIFKNDNVAVDTVVDDDRKNK